MSAAKNATQEGRREDWTDYNRRRGELTPQHRPRRLLYRIFAAAVFGLMGIGVSAKIDYHRDVEDQLGDMNARCVIYNDRVKVETGGEGKFPRVLVSLSKSWDDSGWKEKKAADMFRELRTPSDRLVEEFYVSEETMFIETKRTFFKNLGGEYHLLVMPSPRALAKCFFIAKEDISDAKHLDDVDIRRGIGLEYHELNLVELNLEHQRF